MLSQSGLRNIRVLVQSKRPLVNDIRIAGIVEQTWRYPRLVAQIEDAFRDVKDYNAPRGRATLRG